MQAGKFIITREDLNVDPVTLVTDGLKIGRLPSCELVLNHPTVSRLHAGINETDGRFYFFNFSHSSGTTLNGRVVPTGFAEVVAEGDVVQIGPFFLHFARAGDALSITITLEVAVHIGDAELKAEPASSPAAAPPHVPNEISQALSVFWEKRKREAGKMQRLSPLRPRRPARVLGKARFNWTPTRDLVRPWPFSIFIWGFALVALLSVVATYVFAEAYSPAPISAAHARGALTVEPPIAARANASTCTACHTLTGSMEQNCASCHQTEGFIATTTEAHQAAGIGCTSCHVEHQGTEYRPSIASLQTCTTCHSDANTHTYKGRRVGTPHKRTTGYPVLDGRWAWKGLPAVSWERKPQEVRDMLRNLEVGLSRSGPAGRDPSDVRRSAEFHVIHIHRVKAPEGFAANRDGEVSCSTCHQSLSPIDRETARRTCAACHNGDPGGKFERVLAADAPNCISCHVQHPLGYRTWGRTLLAKASDR